MLFKTHQWTIVSKIAKHNFSTFILTTLNIIHQILKSSVLLLLSYFNRYNLVTDDLLTITPNCSYFFSFRLIRFVLGNFAITSERKDSKTSSSTLFFYLLYRVYCVINAHKYRMIVVEHFTAVLPVCYAFFRGKNLLN